MEGASDDVEGVVSESDEDVRAGGDHGSRGEPLPHAGVDGRESPAETYEARSSPIRLSSLWESSWTPLGDAWVSVLGSEALMASSLAELRSFRSPCGKEGSVAAFCSNSRPVDRLPGEGSRFSRFGLSSVLSSQPSGGPPQMSFASQRTRRIGGLMFRVGHSTSVRLLSGMRISFRWATKLIRSMTVRRRSLFS
jgi:hypothetical protein